MSTMVSMTISLWVLLSFLFALTIIPFVKSEKVKELSLSSLGFNLQNETHVVRKDIRNEAKKPIQRYGFPCKDTAECLARLKNSVCITWAALDKEQEPLSFPFQCTICNITKTCVCDKNFNYNPVTFTCDLKVPLKLGDLCYSEADCLKTLINVDCVFPHDESDDENYEDDSDELGTCECIDSYLPVNETYCHPIATIRPTTTTVPTTTILTTTLQTTTVQTTLQTTTLLTTVVPSTTVPTTTLQTTTPETTTQQTTTSETTTQQTTTPETTTQQTTTLETTTQQTTKQDTTKNHPTTETTSEIPSSIKTSSETSTTIETTTDIIETTTAMSCDEENPHCSQKDMFGNDWIGCINETSSQDCPDGLDGKAYWFCKTDGQFDGRVPFLMQCYSRWLDDIMEEIDKVIKEGKLTPRTSERALGSVKENIVSYLTPPHNKTFGGHEIGLVITLIEKIYHNLTIEEGEDKVKIYENLNEITMAIGFTFFKFKSPWAQLEQVNRSETVTRLISMIEFISLELTSQVTPNNTENGQYNKSYLDSGIYVVNGAQSMEIIGEKILRFPHSDSENSYIALHDDWKSIHPSENDLKEFVGLLIPSDFVHNILPMAKFGNEESEGKSMNGKLMSLSLGPPVSFPSDKPVQIGFEHDVIAWGESKMKVRRKLHPDEKRKAVLGGAKCAFWDTNKLDWSTDGCLLVESKKDLTLCECSHLTAFTVLMDFHDYVGRDPTLEIITLTLCSLSIICLAISIYIFSTVSAIQTAQTTILKNLCVCLLFADLLMLTLVDRNYFHLSDILCSITGLLSHYLFLCAFAWMAIGGWHLYKIVVFVFDTADNYMFVYRLCGYGVPVILVGLTIAIGSSIDGFDAVYGGDNFCWLKGYYIWAFMGPTAFVFMCNLFVFFVTFKKAHSARKVSYTNARVRTYKSQIFGWTSLCFLLGLTWATGYFLLLEASVYFNVSAYTFTILNASQGIAIFIFNCVLNAKVRASIKRKILRQSMFDNTELSRVNKTKRGSRSRTSRSEST